MSETSADIINEVPHPEVWSLALRLHRNGLEYALHSEQADSQLMFGELPFSESISGYARQLEAAVYDNPFLLQPFGKTTIVAESDRFLLLPDEMTAGNADECLRYYQSVYPDDRRNVATNHIKEASLTLAFGIDRTVDAFLQRTFFNPPVLHCLTPLATYFKRKDAYGGRNKMLVYAAHSQVHIIVLKSGRLAFANAFSFASADDAVYYIVNAWQHCELSCTDDELQITGDKDLRQLLLPRLRPTMRNAAQAIFPADLLRLGDNVMAAPFDLIILPLCE